MGKSVYNKLNKNSKRFSIFENEEKWTRLFIFNLKDKLETFIFNWIAMRKYVKFSYIVKLGRKTWITLVVNKSNYNDLIKDIKSTLKKYEELNTKVESQD